MRALPGGHPREHQAGRAPSKVRTLRDMDASERAKLCADYGATISPRGVSGWVKAKPRPWWARKLDAAR